MTRLPDTCANCGHVEADHPHHFLCYGDDGDCRCGGWKKQT